MKTTMRWLAGLIVAGVLGWNGVAQALLFNDWNTDPNVVSTVVTTDDSIGNSWNDITKLWAVTAVGDLYVRMDLSTAPAPGNSAPDYMIYIDDAAGGVSAGQPGPASYVSAHASSVNKIMDAHIPLSPGPTTNHWHTYDAGELTYNFTLAPLSTAIPASAYLQTGTILEWRVPTSVVNSGMVTLTGAAYNIQNLITFDTAILSLVVPEPATGVLVAFAVAGALLRRRR